MLERRDKIDLSAFGSPKLPLRYGTESCYLTLTDDRFTTDIVALRNTPALGKYINYVELSPDDHECWLAGQLEREDALNFVLVAKQRFAGTLSLYNIEHGKTCEFGRMMMPDDGRRVYAVGVELLGMSFAFEILGVQTLYCSVMEGNDPVLSFHLRNGWTRDLRYDRRELINGLNASLIGLSVHRSKWHESFAAMHDLAKRLFV
jgi:RimJ/RimL family protein N-acetyltransferase